MKGEAEPGAGHNEGGSDSDEPDAEMAELLRRKQEVAFCLLIL